MGGVERSFGQWLAQYFDVKAAANSTKGTTHQSTSLPAYYCGICLCRCFTHDDLGTSPVSEAFWECQLTAVDSKGYRNFRIRKPTRCVYRWRFLPNLPFLPAFWRHCTLKLPVYRQLVIGSREQQIYYQLGLSLEAGIDAIHALQLTTNNLSCPVYKSRLHLISYHLEKGLGWSKAFRSSALNTPKTMSFIQSAEKSGRMAQAFKQLALYQQKQLTLYSERISSYSQPLLMLILGGIIGTLLVAMYLPLFSLGEQF